MFDYSEAFRCNRGLVSEAEQEMLRGCTVGIAGMGAVGGEYLVAMARCGVGGFHIADFDNFELKNFNRQCGATMSRLGQGKADVMAGMARDINPEARIRVFPCGVGADNVDEFLDGCDVILDGIDVFEADCHRLLVRRAVERGIPVLAALPVGFGAGMLVFGPGGMDFDRYFGFRDGMSEEQKVLSLVMGFAPAGFHLRYMDLGSVDLRNRKGPSSVGAVKLCAGLVITHALTALLRPEELKTVPWYMHLDARRGVMRQRRLRMGAYGLVQWAKRRAAVWLMERARRRQETACLQRGREECCQ